MRPLLAALLALVLPLSAQATTIRLKTLPEMVAHADQAFQGRVTASRAVQEGTIIVTDYQIEVTEWLKPGPRGRERVITVRQPGGTVGDITMMVEGAAHFVPGEEVVLFTKDYSGLGQQVANLSQGALRVRTEVAPGQAVAQGRRRVPHAGAYPGGAPDDLEAFKARVRELAAGGR